MAPKRSFTAKKPSTGSRRSGRLEMREPRTPTAKKPSAKKPSTGSRRSGRLEMREPRTPTAKKPSTGSRRSGRLEMRARLEMREPRASAAPQSDVQEAQFEEEHIKQVDISEFILQNAAGGEAQKEAEGEGTGNRRPQKMVTDAGTTDDTSSKTASDLPSQDTEILSFDSSAWTRGQFTNAGAQNEEETDGSTNSELLREILHEQRRMEQLMKYMWASFHVEVQKLRREMSSNNSLAFIEMEHMSKKMDKMRAAIDLKIDQLPKFTLVQVSSDLVPPSSQAPSLSSPAPNLPK